MTFVQFGGQNMTKIRFKKIGYNNLIKLTCLVVFISANKYFWLKMYYMLTSF